MVTMHDIKRGGKRESKNRNKRQEVKHEVRGLDQGNRCLGKAGGENKGCGVSYEKEKEKKRKKNGRQQKE